MGSSPRSKRKLQTTRSGKLILSLESCWVGARTFSGRGRSCNAAAVKKTIKVNPGDFSQPTTSIEIAVASFCCSSTFSLSAILDCTVSIVHSRGTKAAAQKKTSSFFRLYFGRTITSSSESSIAYIECKSTSIYAPKENTCNLLVTVPIYVRINRPLEILKYTVESKWEQVRASNKTEQRTTRAKLLKRLVPLSRCAIA